MTTKHKISMNVDIDVDGGMIESDCTTSFDATVTLDGVQYPGAIIVQGDTRGTVSFPGLPSKALELVRWVPYLTSEAICYAKTDCPELVTDDYHVDAAFLLDTLQNEFLDAVENSEDFEVETA